MTHTDEQLDLSKLRYVLYARKSTEDENRQIRSIPDQIADCQKLARDLGLNITEVISETKSAKKPGQRPLFTQMLKDIEAKKYDAILCWHPDRLCRNMLEGGQIINMLDESQLQDIRFNSHQFSNDANGKMLLGMLFVFSKQYSDDLSTKVSRGVKGNFNEGKTAGTPKFGYDRDEVSGLQRPNTYFDLIRQAWKKRANGESVETITNFLNDKGYHRQTKSKSRQRLINPSINSVSKMFHDPFYFGMLVQAHQTIDLSSVYDFQPMIDEDTFNQVQALSYSRTKDKFTTKRTTFYPLRGFVYCAVCNYSKHMLVGKNLSGSKEHVLTYRCDNSLCTRKPKSLRAKHIFESMYKMLDAFELQDEAYSRYSKEIDQLSDTKLIGIREKVMSLRGALSQVSSELNKRALKNGVIDNTSQTYIANEKRIEELAAQQLRMKNEIEKAEQKIANSGKIKLTKDEFLNILKTASYKMRAGSAIEKDVLSRILFLNVRVDNEKVVEYTWNEPFASLVKAVELSHGQGERT